MSDALDDDRLFAVLLDGARADFTACFDHVQGETVYAVALVVSLDLSWALTTVCTEEALDAVVERWARARRSTSASRCRQPSRSCSSSPRR